MIQKAIKRISGNSLKAKFLRGTAWLAVGNVAEKILAFVSKIILARLLMPEDLGLVVLIVSISGLFECLTAVGIKQCIIQADDGRDPAFLNVAWWFSMVRGASLFLIGLLVAPYMCHFYFDGKEQVLARYDWTTLILMVRLSFANLLFQGLISPKAHVLEKDFRFGKVVGYRQSSAIVGTLLTIALSFYLKNAWAMVLGLICQGALRTILSYAFCPFAPGLQWQREYFHRILLYTKGMFGAPFFAYIAYSCDVLVGGKVVGPELIGLYGFAVGLAYVPRDLFARIINPVLMPAFVEQRKNHERLTRTVGLLCGNLIVVAVPVVLVCCLFHESILVMIYGEKFRIVSLVFAIFTFNVVLIMVSMVFVNLCLGLGRPDLHRNYALLRAVILVLAIVPASKYYGCLGMAISQLVANSIMVLFMWGSVYKLISLQVSDLIPNWLRLRASSSNAL